ncbi:MAG: cytochrome c oxidase subunit II [Acidimicrobiia bacterium]|nr:cytochrome c oxidase subunit II [Acidimicrobiia bacterium]
MARPRRSAVATALLTLALAGCGSELGLPEAASEEGDQILGLWRGSVVAALGVAALIWALVCWSVLRYRRRSDDLPSQAPENIPIEVLYTLAPLVVVVIFFVFTIVVQERVTGADEGEDLRVDVTGFQWSWEFDYPELGIEVEGDGQEPPVLVLPVGARVRFDLRTPDVNHSFWVPEFLVKRDLIRRVDNQLWVTVDREGSFVGRCAEFCGTKHWAMRFAVDVVSQAEFDRWVVDNRPSRQASANGSTRDGGQ